MIIFNKFYIELNELENFYIEIQKILGIGSNNKIYKKFGFTKTTRLGIIFILKIIFRLEYFIFKNYLVSYALKQFIKDNIKKKRIKRTYEGIRHKVGLPVRGQRTRSNSKTVRKFKIITNIFHPKVKIKKTKVKIQQLLLKKKKKKNV